MFRNDHRRDPRVGHELPVEIQIGRSSRKLRGIARDLSPSGLCVATAGPFALKSVRHVALPLPGAPLVLRAFGAWQRELPEGLVLSGLEFRDPSDAERERIWDVVFDSVKSVARFLGRGTRLHGLGLDDAIGLAQCTHYRHVRCGTHLYRQSAVGDPGSVFFVVEGAVTLQIRVRDAIEKPFALVEPGDLFGGLALIDDVHAESAVAQTDATLLELEPTAFERLRAAKPWLALRVGSAVVSRSASRLQVALTRLQETERSPGPRWERR